VRQEDREADQNGQVKIIEGKYPQETPPIKLEKKVPTGKDGFHMDQNVSDQKTGKHKEKLYTSPTEPEIIGVPAENG